MKRAKPRQHYRRVKTKKGKKRILVNKGIKGKKKKTYGFMPKKMSKKEANKWLNAPIYTIPEGKFEFLVKEGHFLGSKKKLLNMKQVKG